MTNVAITTDEPVLVLVIPLSKKPSVPPPRKCGPLRIIQTTGEAVGELAPVVPIRKVG
jgi:hypothetical protein